MGKKRIEEYEKDMIETNDGSVFSELEKALIKFYGKDEREEVIKILMNYVENGKIIHWRNFILPDIIRLINEKEEKYGAFFDKIIDIKNLSYWAIDGLLKTIGKNGYNKIIEKILDANTELEVKAKGIKSLAKYSNQKFDRKLNKDPGYWKIKDLRINEIIDWRNNGYKDGEGYIEPIVHKSLKQPSDEFEELVAKLEIYLKKIRDKEQDLSNPTNWLEIASPEDVKRIEDKWKLPKSYIRFITNYSPLNILIESRKFNVGLRIYGAEELIENQKGYSINPSTLESYEGWNENMIVIGDDGADPFCIDISKIKNEDAPVYKSRHGEGVWNYKKYATSFKEFLQKII